MSELRLPKTKREFATLYRKAAARLTRPHHGIRLGTWGMAGQCGEGSGCIGGQFMAVSGAVIEKVSGREIINWYPSQNRTMTKSLSLAITEDEDVGPTANMYDSVSKFIVSFNDIGLGDLPLAEEREKVAARILRRAAYLLDHGGEI